MTTSDTLKLWQSLAGHSVIIGFIALVLLIPLVMVQSLVQDRAQRLDEVQTAIGAAWGPAQSLTTLVLVVPTVLKDAPREVMVPIFPQEASAVTALSVQQRTRGIYSVPVYEAQTSLDAVFTAAEVQRRMGISATPQWERAYIGLLVTERRSAKIDGSSPIAAIDAQRMTDAVVASGYAFAGEFIGRPVTQIEAAALMSADHRFQFVVDFLGTKTLRVVPGPSGAKVTMTGNWPSPSFGGSMLPLERDLTPTGFTATWNMRDILAQATGPAVPQTDAKNASYVHVAVQLNEPVSAYGKTGRVADYGVLFILLTFTAYFLFEVVGRVAVHPMQYALIGCALCLFYLLLLSTSERIGFGAAYVISAGAVVAQMALYTWGIIGRKQGLIIAGIGAALYALLYLLLEQEDIPLFIGAWALFVVLSAVMWLTRKLDWGRTLKSAP